jgi:hypothetical protein
MMKKNSVWLILPFFLLDACTKDNAVIPETKLFTASGDITVKVNEFRNELGTLNTTTGFTTGRREINWDGVPDSLMGIRMPNDFFNPTTPGAPVARQRGLVYAGTDNPVVSKTNLADVNANVAPEFTPFSGSKIFAVVNGSLWPVNFRVAGQNTAATAKGFGIVFLDVDKTNTTFIECFNDDRSLGKFFAPIHDNTNNYSFLGVYFPAEKITHVKIGHEGRLIDGEKDISQGGTKDLVAFDDFIYSEPVVK